MIEKLSQKLNELRAGGTITPAAVYLFAYLFMRTDKGKPITPAPHHELWIKLMCDTSIQRLLIVGTPESAKTTWLLAFLGTWIAFKPNEPNILACSSGAVAQTRTMAIKNIIQSRRWSQIFPDLQPAAGMKWTGGDLSIAHNGIPHAGRIHPTLSAYGVGGSITGSRASLALGDDILDFENTRTAHQRELVADWAEKSFLSRVKSGTGDSGLIRLIGNVWHNDDYHQRIRKNAQGWVTCHIPLLSPSSQVFATITYPKNHAGKKMGMMVEEGAACDTYQYLVHDKSPVLWHDYKSLADILKLQSVTSRKTWAATYQGNPTPDGGAVFYKSWWDDSESRWRSNVRHTNIYISLDTSEGGEGAYTSLVIGFLTADYRLAVKEVQRGRWQMPQQVEIVKRELERWSKYGNLSGIIIEAKSTGVSLIQTLRAALPTNLRGLVLAYHPHGDKITRADRASVWCANGSVLLPEPTEKQDWLPAFESELFDFPNSKYADQVDSFTQLIDFLKNYLLRGHESRQRSK